MFKDGFERAFGYAIFNAYRVEAAVAAATSLSTGMRSPTWQAAVALFSASQLRLEEKLGQMAAWRELAERYRHSSPGGSVRSAPDDAAAWDENEIGILTAIVSEPLIQWRCCQLHVEGEVAIEFEGNKVFDDATEAFDMLVGFDCLLGGWSPETTLARIDDVVHTLMSAHLASVATGGNGRTEHLIPAAQDALVTAAQAFNQGKSLGRRFVAIDCDTDGSAIERSAMDQLTKAYVALAVTSSHPERFRLLWRAILGAAVMRLPWRPPLGRGGSISLTPPSDPTIRRCIRVLAMVHELHKAGYQRIRVLPMMAPSGCYWRAIITYAGNVACDGYHIIDEDMDNNGTVARYTSGQDNEFFGWPDAAALDARRLANLFIQRFPKIASRGEGLDWAYSGWLTDILGNAERFGPDGGLIYLIHDGPTDPEYMRRWAPPPPLAEAL